MHKRILPSIACLALAILPGCNDSRTTLPRIGAQYAVIECPLMAPTPAIADELAAAVESNDRTTIDRLLKAELVGTQESPTDESFEQMEKSGLMNRKNDDGLTLMVMELDANPGAKYAACRLLFHGDDLYENQVYIPIAYFQESGLKLKN